MTRLMLMLLQPNGRPLANTRRKKRKRQTNQRRRKIRRKKTRPTMTTTMRKTRRMRKKYEDDRKFCEVCSQAGPTHFLCRILANRHRNQVFFVLLSATKHALD